MAAKDILIIIALVILIMFSAVFSGLDMSYASVRVSRLEKEASEGNKRAKSALKYATDYDRTIASILFGNDFVNTLASSFASLLAIDLLEPVIGDAASVVMSLLLLFVLLIFGEITPKALCRNRSLAVVKASSGFFTVFRAIVFPFVYPINMVISKLTEKLAQKTGGESQIASDDELENMVDQIQAEGIIDEDQSELLRKSIDFKETNCYEVMTPRVKLCGYDIETPFDNFLQQPNCFAHSRILIYRRDLDHVLGYIPAKTLLKVLIRGGKVDINRLTLPIITVPRTMMISQAMALMKESHHHIALVLDEYGGTDGIITMEDILEELVGELWDEDEKSERFITKLKAKNSYLVHGDTNIDDFLNTFGLDPDVLENEYTTVSGFITHQLERFPKVGDIITYRNLDIEVIRVKNYLADLVIVNVKPDEDSDEEIDVPSL